MNHTVKVYLTFIAVWYVVFFLIPIKIEPRIMIIPVVAGRSVMTSQSFDAFWFFSLANIFVVAYVFINIGWRLYCRGKAKGLH